MRKATSRMGGLSKEDLRKEEEKWGERPAAEVEENNGSSWAVK